jgi:tungstate transport system substrate-binding protein
MKKIKKLNLDLKIGLIFLFLALILTTSLFAGERFFILATTTSVENSGLLSFLLPIFEKKTDIKVKVVARGTGAAIEMGRRGDADAVFVHAEELELEALKQGYFINRRKVCYNDFIIVGPKSDPAHVRGAKTVFEAFKRIAKTDSLFVSRGDRSGTHIKELKIWEKIGVNPQGQKWYLSAGQGMEKTLRIANEKQAYTLTDRGTWLAIKDRLDLAILFGKDSFLRNQYSVMAVNPQRHKGIRYEEAMIFINWITSEEGQRLIGSFRDKQGNPIFIPNAQK